MQASASAASLSIVLDKPFVVGDFLIIDDFLGSIEHVGLKTTRMRSLSGEQLVFSIPDLLSSRIRNYGRMLERRVIFTLGVTCQIPLDKLRKIPELIRKARIRRRCILDTARSTDPPPQNPSYRRRITGAYPQVALCHRRRSTV